jgi:ketosteroid isomerase-like protein
VPTEDLHLTLTSERERKGTMRTVITMVVLALSVGVSACGGSKEQTFGVPDAQAIRQATTVLETAFNAKDVEKILSLYTDNSVFMPPNKPLLRGRGSLKGFYESLLNSGATDLKLTPEDVAGHGPIAYESGSYSMMNRSTHDRGKFLFVFRNLGGNWKIEYTSWSSDFPAGTAD